MQHTHNRGPGSPSATARPATWPTATMASWRRTPSGRGLQAMGVGGSRVGRSCSAMALTTVRAQRVGRHAPVTARRTADTPPSARRASSAMVAIERVDRALCARNFSGPRHLHRRRVIGDRVSPARQSALLQRCRLLRSLWHPAPPAWWHPRRACAPSRRPQGP